MPSKSTVGAEALVAPLYFIALLLVGTSALDFIMSIVPLRAGDVQWRFASLGLLSSFLITPLLGIVVAIVVAQWAGHQRLQRLLAIANLTLAVTFTIVIFAFLLDTFQLQGLVPPEGKEGFIATTAKVMLKYATFVAALGWLSRSGFRMSRIPERSAARPAAVVIG